MKYSFLGLREVDIKKKTASNSLWQFLDTYSNVSPTPIEESVPEADGNENNRFVSMDKSSEEFSPADDETPRSQTTHNHKYHN